jgi:hypothetical protein
MNNLHCARALILVMMCILMKVKYQVIDRSLIDHFLIKENLFEFVINRCIQHNWLQFILIRYRTLERIVIIHIIPGNNPRNIVLTLFVMTCRYYF